MSDVVNSAQQAAPAVETSQVTEGSQENQELESSEELESEELDASEEAKDDAKPEEKKKGKEADKKELEKRIKKLKLKVDNKEYEEEVNFDDDEYLTRQLQLAKMGQKRAQEKAELEGEFRKFFEALQKDPMTVLSQEFQMNPEELIEAYINKQLEQAKKSPEQIEREKLETELKSIRDEREKEKEELRQRELERVTQQEYERMDVLFDTAFSKSDIPRNEYFVKKVADYMIEAVDAGYDVSPEDIIPLVKEELHNEIKQMFQVLPEEMVEQLLGDQVLTKLRKRRIAKAKESQAAVSKPKIEDSGKTSKDSTEKSKEKVSFKDFFGV